MSKAYEQRFSRSLQMKLLLKKHLEELQIGKVEVEWPVCDYRKWAFDVAIPGVESASQRATPSTPAVRSFL